MISPALTGSTAELEQILDLQQKNLIGHISELERNTQGFLTLRHDLATLQKMHDLAPTVILKDNDMVVAYALTMLRECRQLIPDLEAMFALFDTINWQNKPLTGFRFYVMGQICVAKDYRGQGLVEALYAHHREVYREKFDLLVTEISSRNLRSIRAHEKAGFKTVYTHRDALDEWQVVVLDWSRDFL